MQDNRDLFGFDRHRRNHSGSSSLGPAAIREELKYIHDDDDVIVKVCIVMFLHVLGFLMISTSMMTMTSLSRSALSCFCTYLVLDDAVCKV